MRRLKGTGMAWLRSSAWTGGADFSQRLWDDDWKLRGFLLGSSIHGSPEAILAAQQAPSRYFQRPDARHLRLDPDATSLQGWSANASLSKESGRWRLGVMNRISKEAS